MSRLRVPILYRYIFREILIPFVIILSIFTGILFLIKSLDLFELVVNNNVPVSDIILLFSFIIPRFLEIALPMSLLLAIIFAFGRFSSDSELVVIRATGISLKSLVAPVMFLALLCTVFAFFLGFWIRPWANYRLGVGMFEIAKLQASSGLIAGVFNELGPLTVYAEDVKENGKNLRNVVISDRRNEESPRNFIAKRGQITFEDATRTLSIRLFDGSIQEGVGLDYNVTIFDSNDISIDQGELLGGNRSRSGKKSNEMFLSELVAENEGFEEEDIATLSKKKRKRYYRNIVEINRRVVLPFSCLCISLIAIALGIQPSRGGKSWGPAANIIVGIFVILTYYFLLAFTTAIGEQGQAPAYLVMWIPNIVFAALGLYLYRKMGSEEWMAVSQKIGDLFSWIVAKLRLRGSSA